MSTFGPASAANANTVADDDKAALADAACQAAFRLLNDPAKAGRLTEDERRRLKAAADKAWFDLAVYRGELLKQQRRRTGAMPVALASTTTMGGSSTGTPFGLLVAAAALAGAALGAVAAGVFSQSQNGRMSLDLSLGTLRDVSTVAAGTVPRPLPATPELSKDGIDDLVKLGILILEAEIISIDFSTFRRRVVEMMKGIDNLMKQNRNDCDPLYNIVVQLALEIFRLLDGLPANDNDGGQAVWRATQVAIKWMKAVNDLFRCFNIPGMSTPFPNVT